MNVPVVWPAATVTVPGTLTEGDELERLTMSPLGPAGPVRLNVPVVEIPPTTVLGFIVRDRALAAEIVSVAVCEIEANVALIIAAVWLFTPVVEMANVAEDCPDCRISDDGTLAAEMLLERTTVDPEGPAGPVSVTVPVEGEPPRTDVGLSVREESFAGVMASVAVMETAPKVAVIVAVVGESTPIVETAKAAEVWPAAIVTVVGVDADELLLARDRAVPDGPAGPLRVTVPVDEVPPITVVGLMLRPESPAGFTVNVPLELWPFKDAMTAAWVDASTPMVATVKVAVVCPARTVTLEGKDTAFEAEANATVRPPFPAGASSVTVPVEFLPPTTVLGLKDTLDTSMGLIVRLAVRLTPGVAPILATVTALTLVVVTVNVAVVAPLGTVIEPGTEVASLLLPSVTTRPLGGAGKFNVTVPIDDAPPSTVDGFNVTSMTWMLSNAVTFSEDAI